jgi:hypothetical protein
MSKDIADTAPRKTSTLLLQRKLYERKSWSWALVFILKLAILVFSANYLYNNVIRNARFADIYALSVSILHGATSIWLFSACLLLVFVNWGFEALKWQYLVKKFADISFLRSFSAILSGNAVSLLMPNRVGEYIGRVFFLDQSIRIKSIFATFVGSIAQLVITLILGTIGLVYYEKSLHLPPFIEWAIFTGALIFIALLFFFYFHIKSIRSFLPAKKWSKPIRKYLKVYRLYHRPELEKILLYSMVRYLIFSIQFYVLLVFFGVHIPIYQGLMAIFMMYLVQTISPTNGFTELIVRGGTTVFLFKAYTANLTAVLAASYSIWMINLLIPGLAGAIIFGLARINKRRKTV